MMMALTPAFQFCSIAMTACIWTDVVRYGIDRHVWDMKLEWAVGAVLVRWYLKWRPEHGANFSHSMAGLDRYSSSRVQSARSYPCSSSTAA